MPDVAFVYETAKFSTCKYALHVFTTHCHRCSNHLIATHSPLPFSFFVISKQLKEHICFILPIIEVW
jgi:hypothetical protein